MNNQNETDKQGINEEMIIFMKSICFWQKLFSFSGFAGIGFISISSIVAYFMKYHKDNHPPDMGDIGTSLFFCFVAFFPFLFLYKSSRFSKQLKLGKIEEGMESSLKYMCLFWMSIGGMLILAFTLYFLGMFITI
ncbi:MAG: hypothetical protein GY754_19110 [bacterium]|nr:hypothetical protein [bacterium]